jgi:hypothetical protein
MRIDREGRVNRKPGKKKCQNIFLPNTQAVSSRLGQSLRRSRRENLMTPAFCPRSREVTWMHGQMKLCELAPALILLKSRKD